MYTSSRRRSHWRHLRQARTIWTWQVGFPCSMANITDTEHPPVDASHRPTYAVEHCSPCNPHDPGGTSDTIPDGGVEPCSPPKTHCQETPYTLVWCNAANELRNDLLKHRTTTRFCCHLSTTATSDGARRYTQYRTTTNAFSVDTNAIPPDHKPTKQRWSGALLPASQHYKIYNIQSHNHKQRTKERWSGALLPAGKPDPDNSVEPRSPSMATLQLHNPLHNTRLNKWIIPTAGPTPNVERPIGLVNPYGPPHHGASASYPPPPPSPIHPAQCHRSVIVTGDNRPISQLVRQSVSQAVSQASKQAHGQTETHSLGFFGGKLPYKQRGPSSTTNQSVLG